MRSFEDFAIDVLIAGRDEGMDFESDMILASLCLDRLVLDGSVKPLENHHASVLCSILQFHRLAVSQYGHRHLMENLWRVYTDIAGPHHEETASEFDES